MEGFWETWQGRQPQELSLTAITTLEAANAFLEQTWVPFHNRTWTTAAAQEGSLFSPPSQIDSTASSPYTMSEPWAKIQVGPSLNGH